MAPTISLPVKVSLVGASLGIALIGVLAAYFRRRRRPRPYRELSRPEGGNDGVDEVDRASQIEEERLHSLSPLPRGLSNGDLSSNKRSYSQLSRAGSKHTSTASMYDETESVSTVTMINNSQDTTSLTAEQLCDLGLEALQLAVDRWEEALEKIDAIEHDQMDSEMEQLQEQLRQLCERAYRIQENFEQRLFKQASTHIAMDSVLQEMDREYEQRKLRKVTSIGSITSSDQESFVSALDMADLSDIEDHKSTFQHFALYDAALNELENGTIPCRSLRTKMVQCQSDTEFLAKLHCIRQAFNKMFKDASIRDFFANTGRKIISSLMLQADREPEEFQIAYDDMLTWVKDENNWILLEEELKGRGVRTFSFYDIVIDFILFDAFDDLDCPPSSVTTVVNNRWLSNGFKETALSTAVWSVLKAKRRMLRFPDGFISHFYAISEHTSPVFAWGFLGPAGQLRDICYYFKEEINGFMIDAFSFEKSRYTTVDQLAQDLYKSAKDRALTVAEKLS